MRNYLSDIIKLLSILILATLWSGCTKKFDINPDKNFSYKIKNKQYNYPYSSSFGFSTISARSISGGFEISANYTSTSHNTINMLFFDAASDDLPHSYYSVTDGGFTFTLDNYKGPDGNFYILDKRYEQGYIKFDHVSKEYVSGTFDVQLVRTDRDDNSKISYSNTIHLKNGQFHITLR